MRGLRRVNVKTAGGVKEKIFTTKEKNLTLISNYYENTQM